MLISEFSVTVVGVEQHHDFYVRAGDCLGPYLWVEGAGDYKHIICML